MSNASITSAFKAAMEAKGIMPPDKIISDGKLHHFSTNGKRKDDAGRYILYTDGVPAGWFKDWRTGGDETWCAKSSQIMSTKEREAHRRRIEKLQQIRQAEEAEQHRKVAQACKQIVRRGQFAQESHPYLVTKGIGSHGAHVDKAGTLLVPVYVEFHLSSIQRIFPDGTKRFWPGGKTRGGYFPIGDAAATDQLCICEGFGTAAAVHESTGLLTIAAFSANNLELVARAWRKRHPNASIIIAGDNDKNEVGQRAAQKTATAIGGCVALPSQPGDDWNDVFRREGPQAVKQAIEAAMTSATASKGLSRMNAIGQEATQASSSSSFAGAPGANGAKAETEHGNDAPHEEKATGASDATGTPPTELPEVEGYRIDENGVFENGEEKTRLTLRPCAVLAYCRDASGQNWGAFLRWQDRDQHYHEGAFPIGRFHEPGGGLVIDLAGLGLPIVPGMERRLLRYFASGNPVARYQVASQTGWTENGNFVLPTRTVGPSGNERIVFQPERHSPTRNAVRMAGDLDGWKSEVAARCVGNPVLMFWLSASFAAPLLNLLELEGGGFHLFGLTSKGKTTAEQVAASVWGDASDPAEGRPSAYVKKWNLTKNATEGLAEMFNDLTLCLDEVGEVDTREFGRMIYQLAGGQGKSRMRADATLKDPKVWRTLLLSTGELPASDVIEDAGRRVKGGQIVRLIDIPATHPATGLGIIEHLHGSESPAHFVDALKRSCADHYGHAGPAFIEELIKKGLPTVRAELKAAFQDAVSLLTPKDASPELQRIVKRIALVAVAGATATSLAILPWSASEAIEAAKGICSRVGASRDGSDGDLDRAIGSLREFLLKHGGTRFRELSSSTEKVFDLAGYRDELKAVFYFTPQGFKEACGGVDPRTVARELKAKGHLRTSENGRLTEKIVVPGMGRPRLYSISAKILDDEAEEGAA